MAFSDILDHHHECEVVIIPRFHKGKPKLIHGLYCANHGKLIKWLRPEQSRECQQLGVELLAPVKEDRIKLMRQQIQFEFKLKETSVLPRRSSWI
jgi:hypothetical protein